MTTINRDTEITHRGTAIETFADHPLAQQAVAELIWAGFREDQIGVVGRDSGQQRTTATDNAEEAAMAGVVVGAGLGALWGIGIAAGLLPAIGPVIAGGTLAAILASAATGAATGTVAGLLIGLGFSEDEADFYEKEFQSGRTIVTVHTGGRYEEARAILSRVKSEGSGHVARKQLVK